MSAAPRMNQAVGLARDVFGGKSPRDMFVILLAHGFWPITIYPRGSLRRDGEARQGKEPMGKEWGLERWTLERANAAFRRMKAAGLGACVGPGRGPDGSWMIDVEGDGPEAEESRQALFGGEELETLGWGSTRGGHSLLTVDPELIQALLPRLKSWESEDKSQPGVYKTPLLPGLELRIGGYKPDGVVKQLQSVVPPTPGTDGRPRLWTGPAIVRPVPGAFYQALENMAPKAPASNGTGASLFAGKTSPSPFAGKASTWKVRAVGDSDQDHEARRINNYVMMALADEAAKVAGTPEGKRHDAMRGASVNMAGLIKGADFPEGVYRKVLADAAAVCNLPGGEASDLIESALQVATPRDMTRVKVWKPESKTERNGHHETNGNAKHSDRDIPPPEADVSEDVYAGATEAELGIIDAADVTLENPVWLWDRRFLRGKINLIAGEGGDGKTTVAILVGSTVIQGGTFPDGSPAGPPGMVMILAAEDGAGDTIKPRFIAAGADLSAGKLKFLTAAVNIPKRDDRPAMVHPVCLKDLVYWRAVFRRYRPDVLIIDPLPAYLGRGVNDNKNSDVQEALKGFAQLASEFSVCVIAITHTGKATDRKLIHKVLGSVAYTNVARVVHVTIKDPNKPNVRYLERPKCNLDEPVDALAYKLVSAEFEHDGMTYKTSRAEIDPEPVAIDAEAMTNPKREGARGPDPKKEIAVAEWLFDFLDGHAGWTERKDVLAEAGRAGLIGTYNPQTKKWSNGTVLYRGKDRISELKDPRANRRVEEQDMRTTNDRYPRMCWRLFDQDSPF